MKKPRFGATGQKQEASVTPKNPHFGSRGQASGNKSYRRQPRFGAIGQPKATSATAGGTKSRNSRRGGNDTQ